MLDLSTTYLGLKLINPLAASASPLCESLDNLKRMEDAGAALVVLPSLFEEQITLQSLSLDRHLSRGSESYAEALSYFPDVGSFRLGPESYLEHLRTAKEALSIPVAASLNGFSSGGWIKYARLMEEAGADAIELNTYYMPADPEITSSEVEEMYLELVRNVTASVSIPVAVKLSPYFSAFANFALRLDQAGADGFVIFNRFYQPDFDLDTLEVTPNLHLSHPSELLLRLRWAAILHGHVRADIAITGGVHSADDVIKSMMAGARVAMMTSALLQRGIGFLSRVQVDMMTWMEEREYTSIAQMQGSMSQRSVADPAAFERANYMKVLKSFRLS